MCIFFFILKKIIFCLFFCFVGYLQPHRWRTGKLASGAVDRGFEPRSGQIKDYKIGICGFSARHVAFRSKSTHWLAWNQDNVSEWGDMSIHGLLLQ
jgi:hypothetical protein